MSSPKQQAKVTVKLADGTRHTVLRDPADNKFHCDLGCANYATPQPSLFSKHVGRNHRKKHQQPSAADDVAQDEAGLDSHDDGSSSSSSSSLSSGEEEQGGSSAGGPSSNRMRRLARHKQQQHKHPRVVIELGKEKKKSAANDEQEEEEDEDEDDKPQTDNGQAAAADKNKIFWGDKEDLVQDDILKSNHLAINKKHHVAVCTSCGIIVSGSKWARHCKRHHKLPLSRDDQLHINELMRLHNALDRVITFANPADQAPIQGLAIYPAFACSCGQIAGTDSSRTQHEVECQICTWEPVQAQQASRMTSAFAVVVPDEFKPHPQPPTSAQHEVTSLDTFAASLPRPAAPVRGSIDHLGERDIVGLAHDLGWLPTVTAQWPAEDIVALFAQPTDQATKEQHLQIRAAARKWMSDTSAAVEASRVKLVDLLHQIVQYDNNTSSSTKTFSVLFSETQKVYATTIGSLLIMLVKLAPLHAAEVAPSGNDSDEPVSTRAPPFKIHDVVLHALNEFLVRMDTEHTQKLIVALLDDPSGTGGLLYVYVLFSASF
jgi:hypothetical protein